MAKYTVNHLSRRDFIRLGGLLTASTTLVACGLKTTVSTSPVPTASPTTSGPDLTNTTPVTTAKVTDKTNGGITMTTPETSYADMPYAMQRGVDKDGWRILGPGGGGAMYIPTPKPDDPETALVACDMTGAYITRDGGQTWKEINLRSRVYAFAFHPADTKIIYAGSTGLYRSEDVGRTWRLVFPNPAAVTEEKMVGDHADHSYRSSDNWPGGRVETIHIDPGNSNKLWIGINSGGLKIFGSIDGGGSWTEGCPIEGKQFTAAFLDPTSPAEAPRLFVLTDAGVYRVELTDYQVVKLPTPSSDELINLGFGMDKVSRQAVVYLTTPARWEGGAFRSGVYRSADLGETWEELKGGLEADLLRNGYRRFTCISTCLTDASIVYLAAAEPAGEEGGETTYFGIFKSEDGGKSWKWALRIGKTNPENRSLGWVEKDFSTEWGGAPFYIGVSPTDPAVCYVTDWGTTYRSIDGGKTWQQLYCQVQSDGSVTTRGLDVINIYWICFDPFDKDHLVLACTDIGVFHSKNGGRSWSHALQGVPRAWVNTCYAVAFDPQVQGKVWSAWSECHDLPRPKMFRSGRFSQYRGGVCKTEDGLESWVSSSRGLPANCAPTDIVVDPKSSTGKRTLYLAVVGKGVYKSIDDGKSWQAKNEGLHGNLNAWRIILLPDGTLYLLVCRGLEGGKVIDGALYKSSDGAESWQSLLMPQGANFPNDLVFDPSRQERLYLACWPTTVDGEECYGGLYRSEDGGSQWTNLCDPASHVYGVAVDRDRPSTVYMTNFEGAVYRSDDMGNTWHKLGGYNFKWAKQPILDPYNPDMLYVTTFGSSVWYGPARGVEGAFEDIYGW